MKRKSEDNPAVAVANGDLSGSKKRRRLSGEGADAKPSKKDKKSKKSRKTKAEDEILDLPVPDYDGDENVEEASAVKKADATETVKDDTKSPKKKKDDKNKKDKKSEKQQPKTKQAPADTAAPAGDAADKAEAEDDDGEAATGDKPAKKNRFIVFVGNLPYSATAADIEKHFSAVKPTSVRLLHQRADPKKSRGVAFVEFAGYDHMKTCLKTLHQSTFTCEGRDHRGRPKVEERKINVELTAGGGGNTEARKEKIKAKNQKLQEERERRAIAEEKERIKKEKERLTKGGQQKTDEQGVHPSRRGRVPGRS